MQPNKFDEYEHKEASTGRKLALIAGVLFTLLVFSLLMIRHLSQTLPGDVNSLRLFPGHVANNRWIDRETFDSSSSLNVASYKSPADRRKSKQKSRNGHHHHHSHHSSSSTGDDSRYFKNGIGSATGSSAEVMSNHAPQFAELLEDLREPSERYRKTQLITENSDANVIVRVSDWAQVKGVESRRFGRTIYKFLGVPYAQPPIGSLRFAEPVEYRPQSIEHTLDATRFGPICPQFFDEVLVKTVSPLSFNMSEDCLKLNIWTPILPKTSTTSSTVSASSNVNPEQVTSSAHWTLLSKKTLDFEDDPVDSNATTLNPLAFTTPPTATTTSSSLSSSSSSTTTTSSSSSSDDLDDEDVERAKRDTNVRRKHLLPVMVWIHGGGFSMGSAALDEYDGQVLASYGQVLVVTINYRVGVFGFFNMDTSATAGNQGLKDQQMALRWVRDHIEPFGGDPERVTLFGQSAGAFAVGLHMLAPAGQKLFKRAILQSGSPLVFDQFYANTINIANTLVRNVQCSTGEPEDEADADDSDDGGESAAGSNEALDSNVPNESAVDSQTMNLTNAASMNIVKGNLMNMVIHGESTDGAGSNATHLNEAQTNEQVLRCMRSRTMKQLIRAQKKAMQQSTFPFSPNRDANFLPHMPAELLKLDLLRDRLHDDVQQVMLGVNRDEGSLYLHLGMPDLFPADKLMVNITRLSELRSMLAANLTTGFKVPRAQAQLVAGLLLSNGPEIDTRENLVRKYHQLLADLMFNCPSVLLAEELAKGRRGGKSRSVYFYRFNERPTVTNWGDWMGVTHHEEVQFVFGLPLRYPLRYAIKDQVMSKRIIRTWSHFARTG